MTEDGQRRSAYLQAMGITPWLLRDRDEGTADEVPAPAESPPSADEPEDAGGRPASPAAPVAPPAVPALSPSLDSLREQVAACTACPLHESRTRTVFGVGNPRARCLLIGEAPGAEEDRKGEPFVGRAGQLLNAMLAAIGQRREDVFIANILKCRPPSNRDPRPEEVACCAGFLRRQIELIEPAVIVAVGRVAAQNLLGTTTSLGRLRGVMHEYAPTGTPVLVTFHPAYLLRKPQDKRLAWQDLRKLRSLLAGEP